MVASKSDEVKRCSIEGCGNAAERIRRTTLPYCEAHDERYGNEWNTCSPLVDGCARWASGRGRCGLHGGTDYTPRTSEAPQQESSATTAREEEIEIEVNLRSIPEDDPYFAMFPSHVSVTMCAFWRGGWCGGTFGNTVTGDFWEAFAILVSSTCEHARHHIWRTTSDHTNPAPPEAKPCYRCNDSKRTIAAKQGGGTIETTCWSCLPHAPPEAQSCDDGKEENTPAEELLSLGVPPLVPLTPEERAQDLVRWRRDIEWHRRGKEEK